MPIKILMVCLGNICRSPLAEGILASKLPKNKFTVDSAGTGSWHIGHQPDERSIAIAKKNKIDLIVMGSHGSSGIEELLIGSNTEKVVRLSDIPVLVIKKDIGKFEGKNFVFASDFSNEIKKPFKKMIEFTKIFDANLFLVMISTPNSFKPTLLAEKIMSDFIADLDIQNYSLHIFNDVNVESGILNFSNAINADLIGLCTHGRTGLAHFFNGSISEDLVNHAVKPVITFKI